MTLPKNLSRILSLIFSFMLVGLFAHPLAAKDKTSKRSGAQATRSEKIQAQPPSSEEKLQEEMEKYLGVRYKRGGDSTKGFDCSGFVKQIYGEVFGVNLPHQSSEQNQSAVLMKVSSDELKMGDLVFFSAGHNKKGINHVGIYLSDGKFIHSARSKGVIVSSIEDPYWRARLVSSRRLSDRENLVAGGDSRTVLGLGAALDDTSLFAFQVTASQFESYYPSLVHNELHQSPRDSSYRTEFSFLKGLWAESWSARLTAFREHFSLPHEDPFLGPRPILGGESDSAFSTKYSQGLRVASDMRPNQWLRVSPSVTYFEYGPGIDFTEMPKVALGLDFNLASSSDGWSLSTGFQYPLSKYASARLSDADPQDSRIIDMSFTFRQWLTDRVHFSVTGERSYRHSGRLQGSPAGFGADDHQVSFALQFFY